MEVPSRVSRVPGRRGGVKNVGSPAVGRQGVAGTGKAITINFVGDFLTERGLRGMLVGLDKKALGNIGVSCLACAVFVHMIPVQTLLNFRRPVGRVSNS